MSALFFPHPTSSLRIAGVLVSPSPIVGLLFWRCPPYIPRLIVLIVVDAVDAHSRRASPDFGKDICEECFICLPKNANLSATISVISLIVGIFTALDHSSPYSVFSRLFAALGFAMSKIRFMGALALQAAARLRSSAAQALSGYDRVSSAVAAAIPQSMGATVRIMAVPVEGFRCQATEALTCDINEFGHDDLLQGSCAKWRLGVDRAESPRIIAEAV